MDTGFTSDADPWSDAAPQESGGSGPHTEDEVSMLRSIMEAPIVVGADYNLMEAKWLRQWKSFVSYDGQNEHYFDAFQEDNPGPIPNDRLCSEAYPGIPRWPRLARAAV